MAINNIPGVGPANSDIATAVSTAVPTIGQITSAITSNAASAGVTMAAITSAITTNAASAGVTMAAITNAITSNAASAGVTIAAITSAGNSAGWGTTGGETWTAVASGTFNGSGTYTFSGLSGYKTYRFVYSGNGMTGASGREWRIRLNNITTNTYTWAQSGFYDSSIDSSTEIGVSYISINFGSGYFRVMGNFTIEQANLTGYKMVNMTHYGSTLNNNRSRSILGFGMNTSDTSPINRIDFYVNADGISSGAYALYGGN